MTDDRPGASETSDVPPGNAGEGSQTPADTPQITAAELQARLSRGDPVRVLDLRDRDEVERWSIAHPSVALTQKPNNRFLQAKVTDSIEEFVADVDGEGPITVVCGRGEASAAVARELAAAGYDVHNLAGGMEAWARLLTASEIDAGLPGDAALVQYRRPASGCLGYLVVSGDEAAVVDPLRAFTDRYVADAAERGASIEYVLDTHVHADHVSGLRELATAADAEPMLPQRAVDRGVAYEVTTVGDGEELLVGDVTLTAVAAPGHTTGMTAFAVGDALLTGDSLFVDGVARPDLERGDEAREFARELHRTLTERFARFRDGTVVAPGHHGEGGRPNADGTVTATLGACRDLPVFELAADEFVDRVAGDLPPRPANAERIVAINLGRESADAETAFELELGPNNCAATPAE